MQDSQSYTQKKKSNKSINKVSDMETKSKKYDLTKLSEFFEEFESPAELMDDIVKLAFNYADKVSCEETELFKQNMGTLYVIYDQLSQIKQTPI